MPTFTRFNPESNDALAHEAEQAEFLDIYQVAISSYSVPQLRAIAAAFNWPVRGLKREAIVAQMIAHYCRPEAGQQMAATLDKTKQGLLALCGLLSAQPLPTLANAAETLRQQQPDALPALRKGESLKQLEELQQQGLLFELGDWQRSFYIVAPPLLPHLYPAPALQPPAATLAELRPYPATEDPVATLALLWQQLQRHSPIAVKGMLEHEPTILFRGWPIARGQAALLNQELVPLPTAQPLLPTPLLDELAARLKQHEPGQIAFFTELLRAAEALVLDRQSKSLTVDEGNLTALLSMEPRAQMHALQQGWLLMPFLLWNEFLLIPPTGPQPRLMRHAHLWHFTLTDFEGMWVDARIAVYNLLRLLLPPTPTSAGWFAWQPFSQRIQQWLPTVLAHNGLSFVNSQARPLNPTTAQGWAEGSEVLLAAMFHGPLRWLGITETALNNSGQLAALRLTARGVALLQEGELPTPPAPAPAWDEARLEVQLAPAAGNAALLSRLRDFGEPGEAQKGQLRFRLSPHSVRQAFESGLLPADLHAPFEAAGHPLPASVGAALARWWRLWGRLHQYDELALIELADALLAAELLAVPTIAQHVVARPDPTMLLVPRSAVAQIVAQLEQHNHRPQRID